MTAPEDEGPDDLLLRRGTALFLELFFVRLVVLPAGVLLGGADWFLVVPLFYGLAVVLRDAMFGGTSPGKRLVGLRVVHTHSDAPPRPLSAMLRNIPLFFFGLGWMVELFAAGSHAQRRRFGDRIADTQVVEADASRRRLPWPLIFFVTWFGSEALLRFVEPRIYAWVGGLG